MDRVLRPLAIAGMCGAMATMGACTSGEDEASTSDSTARAEERGTAFNFASEPEWLKQANLLTWEEVAAALGESVLDMPREWEGSVVCDHPLLKLAPTVGWEASTYLDFQRSDARVSTDVVVCSITDADSRATSAMYADLETSAPPRALVRYEPASIGVAAFAWELDGEGGALDRFVVVNTGEALVGIVANRHSPVAEGDNLTREQVDTLVRAAVDKLG